MIKKFVTCISDLSISQKLYLISVGIGLISGLMFTFGSEAEWVGVMMLAVAIGACATLIDLSQLYKCLWSKSIGKALILLVFAFVTNAAFAIGTQIVNSIIGVDPSKLIYSITFASFFTIWPFISIVMFFLSVLLTVFFSLYIVWWYFVTELHKNIPEIKIWPLSMKEPKPGLSVFFRCLYFAALSGFMWKYYEINNKAYNEYTERKVAQFTYSFQAFEKSRCQLAPGERVIPVNDREVVVGRKSKEGVVTFELEKCSPILE